VPKKTKKNNKKRAYLLRRQLNCALLFFIKIGVSDSLTAPATRPDSVTPFLDDVKVAVFGVESCRVEPSLLLLFVRHGDELLLANKRKDEAALHIL
jgi:hypothetical protein